ncbi:hypothetical protein BDF21DRAFT_410373 [Thamnidium elegans]|nr:hypothetical protein BDF21DRAFT_410373 [Thamnidium elegans]
MLKNITLIAIFTNIVYGATFICPKEDIEETRCLGPKDCVYQNPNNCNTYIFCALDENGENPGPVVYPCEAGLKWNDRAKMCDWPANATC